MIDNWHVLQDKGPGRVAPTFIANGLVDAASGMIAIDRLRSATTCASSRPAPRARTCVARVPSSSGAAMSIP